MDFRAGLTHRILISLTTAVIGVGLTTALIAWLRAQTSVPNGDVLYIISVLGLAILFGRGSAIVAAVLAFLATNFFFVAPYFTLHVAEQDDWLALGVLLVTAIVTGQLAAALRDRAQVAEARERELRALHKVATEAEVLRQADEVKSALLSSVSHDLRTPLASIKAAVTTLLDDSAALNSGTRRELLLAVNEESDRLTRFVGRLLDLSRLEGGAVQPTRDWHALDDVLSEVADRLDPGRTRVSVRIDDSPSTVFIDYVMVGHILTNLVENALKYAPPESVVEISASFRNGLVVVEVCDRGPGVSPAEVERIFERFYRSASPKAGTSGTGIGLAIARGLARAHDGDVVYEPRPGGGSIFRLSLPVSTAGAVVPG